MFSKKQVYKLNQIIDAKAHPYTDIVLHECADRPSVTCPGCAALEAGYLNHKPYPVAKGMGEILKNVMWHIIASNGTIDVSETSTDPIAEALWLVFAALIGSRLAADFTDPFDWDAFNKMRAELDSLVIPQQQSPFDWADFNKLRTEVGSEVPKPPPTEHNFAALFAKISVRRS